MKLTTALRCALLAVSATATRCSLVPGPFNTTWNSAIIGNNTYSYLESIPAGDPIDTIFLLHGFPDLSYGWRYQVPFLTSLGYHVIIPDMLGYGRSSAPTDLSQYALKKMSDDMAALVTRIVGTGKQVILGGHDWGAGLVWRAAMYHADLWKGIFGLTVPFIPPVQTYVDLAVQVADNITPTFGYQLQFRNTSTDARLAGAVGIRELLLALYGAVTPEGEPGFMATKGLLWDNLPLLGSSPLVSDSDVDYYQSEYMNNTVRGPLSWYRTAQLNFADELPIAMTGGWHFDMPALFVAATDDTALPPYMSDGMEKYFSNLTKAEVSSSHWVLWQAAGPVNQLLQSWLNGLESS